MTRITPKDWPTGFVFLKIFSISLGVAEVEISNSLGSIPIYKSRTAPPTINAAWPFDSSSFTTNFAPLNFELSLVGLSISFILLYCINYF